MESVAHDTVLFQLTMNGNVLRKLAVIQHCQMYMIKPKAFKFHVLFFERTVWVVKLSGLKVQSIEDNRIGMLKIKRKIVI